MIIILRFLNSLMDGGVDTGFNHVEPEQYKPRLLKVSGSSKKVQVTEVSLRNSSWSSHTRLAGAPPSGPMRMPEKPNKV